MQRDDSREVVQSLGQVLIARGDVERAEQVFINDHKTYPDRLDSLGQAAALAWKRGARNKALQLAAQVLLERPLDARALEVMIRNSLAQKQDGMVGLLLERAKAGNVQTPELCLLAGQREQKRGQHAKALRSIVKEPPGFPTLSRSGRRPPRPRWTRGMQRSRMRLTRLLNQAPRSIPETGSGGGVPNDGALEEAARLYVNT